MGAAFAGRLAVRRVYGLVERLTDEPWSRHRAFLLGGDEHWREHLGWGPAEYLQAALIDAIQVNTAVTAAHGSGKRAHAQQPFHRPTITATPGEPSAATLDAVPWSALEAMLNFF